MGAENRYQSEEMLRQLAKIAWAQAEVELLRRQLREKYCTHLFANGKSAFDADGSSFSYCKLCGERR